MEDDYGIKEKFNNNAKLKQKNIIKENIHGDSDE